MTAFSRRLKEARQMRGFSQATLAKRARLQVSAVSHFETGTRAPSLENLRKLVDALQVTADFLLGRKDDFSGVVDDPLWWSIQRLSPCDRSAATRFVEAMTKRSGGPTP